jgi:WD40 repeat protein
MTQPPLCTDAHSPLSLPPSTHTPNFLSFFTMPDQQPYELAFQLHGHASDVRTLHAPSPDIPLLISGSRDGSALLWGPGRGKEWDVKLRVEAPEKKYVSCVGMTRWNGEGELSASSGIRDGGKANRS